MEVFDRDIVTLRHDPYVDFSDFSSGPGCGHGVKDNWINMVTGDDQAHLFLLVLTLDVLLLFNQNCIIHKASIGKGLISWVEESLNFNRGRAGVLVDHGSAVGMASELSSGVDNGGEEAITCTGGGSRLVPDVRAEGYGGINCPVHVDAGLLACCSGTVVDLL